MNIFNKNNTIKILTLIISIGLLFAVVGCREKKEDTIAVTGITLQSEGDIVLIQTHRGTLQLSSTITPSDATNQTVTWSVIMGTGTASIDQYGLLTAITDGSVTAKVVSNDTPSISAQLVITISHQVIDYTAPLADAIVLAHQNKQETNIGLNSDDFVPSVQWVLNADQMIYADAIADAELILAQQTLTENEVNDAVETLALATQTFNSSKKDGTKVIIKIDLGSANDFVILSKTGISTTGTTSIIGHIGVSPVSASYITGFGLTMDSSNAFSTSSVVTGQIYAADYSVDTPAYLTTAIADMLIAYDDGAGRTADYTQLYTGDLSGKTLTTGVYMWSNEVLINTDLTLHGSSTDIFIFQIAGGLTMAANTEIILTGGLLPENIFWIVADTVAIGVSSDFMGIILSKTNVSMNTGSTITGMIYAQTSVSLDATTVTKA